VLLLAVQCVDRLAEQGVSVGLVSLHTVKPLDEALLAWMFAHYSLIAVLEWGCAEGVDLRKLRCFGAPDRCGQQPQARATVGLEPVAITQCLWRAWRC
jgi:transketolase